MLSFVTFPTRSIFTILPSAGETITRGSDGISRAGFRKKNPTNPESNSNKTTATYKPKTAARLAEISNGTIKLNASLIIMGGKKFGDRRLNHLNSVRESLDEFR